jgi:hypothetical protein
MSAERALAASVRGVAAASAAVRALIGDPPRLYDDPPLDVVFPYVTVGRVESRTADASASAGTEHALTLHVWSRHGGRAEALDVIAALRTALHDSAATVPGYRLVFLFAVFADVFRSGDGRTTHAVLRLKAMTEPL